MFIEIRINHHNINLNKENNTIMKSINQKIRSLYQKFKTQIANWIATPDMTLSEYYRIEAYKNPNKQIRNPWEQM